jgi:MFS transporter, AAHS family, 4-hydroxybenzoate transporter
MGGNMSGSPDGSVAFDVGEFLDRPRFGGYRILIFTLCTLVMAVDGYDVFVVGYLVPALAQDFGVPLSAVTSIFVFQTIGLGLGAYAVSPFADRFGRRNIILICTALLGLLTLAGTLATSTGELAALRFVASFFFGAVVPNLVAVTSEYCSRRSRPILVIILFMGYTVGAGGGGSIASALAAQFGWRAAFWMGGLTPLVVVALLYVLLPESIRFMVLKGDRSDEVMAHLRRIDPALQLSGPYAFSMREENSGAMPVVALFRHGRAPTTLLLWLSYAMNLFVLTFIASWMPTFLRVFAGVDLKQAGAIAALFSLGGILSPLALGYFIDRHGATRVLAANYVAAGISIILIGLAGADARLAAIGVFCAGLFVIGGQGGINALASMLYPTEMRATGVGWALGAGRVASVFGPMAGGAMLKGQWSAAAIFATTSVPVFIAALATICVRFSRRPGTALADRNAVVEGRPAVGTS